MNSNQHLEIRTSPKINLGVINNQFKVIKSLANYEELIQSVKFLKLKIVNKFIIK